MTDVEPKQWIVDKRINLSNLLTASLIAISIFWWAAHLEKRVAILEVNLTSFYEAQLQLKELQMHRDNRQDTQVERLEKTMKEGFERLHVKLDQLVMGAK